MNKPKISIIVAMDEKRGIGKGMEIPWRIPGEQRRFKEITTPHPLIMGRKTFESLGRILPNRPHIIITRDPLYKAEGTTVCHTIEDGIAAAKSMDSEKIFIIGGGQIYKEAMEKGLVDRLYLTLVRGDFGANVFFPDYSAFTKSVQKEALSSGEYVYTFLVLEK